LQWGLAIHEQSRLIAVSSNLREITVFTLAIKGDTLDGGESSDNEDILEDDPSYDIPAAKEEFPLLPYCPSSVRQGRHSGYRLVFSLGYQGHNVPSIDFSSNQDFEAESIFATDIRGNLVSYRTMFHIG
jgi:hypothetical protein